MANLIVGRLTALLDMDDTRFQSGARAAGSSMRQLGTQSRQAESAIAAAMRDAVKDVDRYAAKAEQARANLAAATQRQARAEGALRAAQRDDDGARIASAEVRLAQARARTTAATNSAREAAAGLAEARRLEADSSTEAAAGAEAAAEASDNSAKKLIAQGVAAAGAAVSLGSILTIGMDYRRQLNEMGAVSQATSAQMGQVGARARELGNDITLPGTSANDAAAAMTNLTKGGFTVQQSMDAAKGSLTLAAAAQIDAASAADIQSKALQAFGKDASYAGAAADILSNTSNASSAEITDVAQALQQAGLVANGFGVDMADTATMIGLFANAGITGSDAGTLLKTSLQSLTDQSESAQGAIDTLGLTVYDQNGRFVGMRSLYEQLSKASKSMSDEQFQAATNVLFGSDAMRAAMAAAGGGVEAYDKMRDAIGRQGTAAELANAKMQGLPGAWERVQNALESFGLSAYDVAEGSLTALANSGADVIGVGEGLFGALSVLATPVVALAEGFGALPGPIQTTVVAVGLLRVASMLFGNQIGAVQSRVTGLVGGLRASAGATSALIQTQRAGTVQMGRFGATVQSIGNHVPVIGRMQTAFINASTAASAMPRTIGLAAGAMSGMRSAAGGLMGALGGPWGLAITGAIGLLTLWMSKKREDAAASQAAAARTTSYADALKESGGAIDANIRGLIANDEAYKGARDAADKLKISQRDLSNAMVDEAGASERMIAQLNEVAEKHKKVTTTGAGAKSGMQETKTTYDSAGKAALTMRDQILQANKELDEAKTKAQRTAEATGDMSVSFDGSQRSVGPMAEAMTEFSQSTDGAQDKVSKLAKALDDLNSGALTEENAIQGWSDSMRSFAESLKDGGAGAVLLNGHVDVTTEKGSKLQDSVESQAKAFNELAVATYNAAKTQGQDTPQALDTVSRKLTEQRRAFIDASVAAGMLPERARALADAYGLIPEQVVTRLNVEGLSQAITSLNELGVKTKTLQPGQLRILDNTPDVVAKLNQLQIKYTTLPDGRIAITDTTPENIKRLGDLGIVTKDLPKGFIQVTDTSAENMARLEALGVKTTTLPNGMVVINADDRGFQAAVARAQAPGAKDIQLRAVEDEKIRFWRTVGFFRSMNPQSDASYSASSAPRADGAIVPMADGGMRSIRKPVAADIYAGRGDGTVFAEEETGGESYIPLAPNKRERSVAILAETARLFGLSVVRPMADGGVAGYGLPAGATGGFPDWVTKLGDQYGVKPSTYAGHQTSDRAETGYAPNPQGLNRGIDWGGSVAAMRAFAKAMFDRAQGGDTAIEQVIFQDPETGEKIGWGGGKPDADGSYFAADYAAHQDHVHLRVSSEIGAQATGTGPDTRTSRQKNIDTVIAEGRKLGKSPKQIKAAVMALLAEANGEDPGDAPNSEFDSEGGFQQRPSMGWGPASEDLATDARQFYERLPKDDSSMTEAQMAQSVQRSAFSDGSNYQAKSAEADQLIAESDARGNGASMSSDATTAAGGVQQVFVTNWPSDAASAIAPSTSTTTSPSASASKSKLPDGATGRGPLPLVAYAAGGIDARSPGRASMLNSERMWITQAGEAGTEAYIPINSDPRSRALWVETGRRLGLLQSFASGGFGGYSDDTSDYMAPRNFYDWAALTAGAGFAAASAITPYVGMATSKQVNLGDVSPTFDTGSNSIDGVAQALGQQFDALGEQFKELIQAVRDNKKVYVTNQPSSGDGAASVHLLTAGM